MAYSSYTTIDKVPANATFVSDSQDIDALREYVPNGKELVSAFVIIVDGEYLTIYADYSHSVPYLANEVRRINVRGYIAHKIADRRRNRK